MVLLARLFAAATVLLFAQQARAETITVMAAASLKTALDEIAADYGKRTGDRVVLVYGGSGLLARQIIAGAPADIFISANGEWMDAAADAGLIDKTSRRNLLGNRLVLVGTSDAEPLAGAIGPDTNLAALIGDGRLAMGLVTSVPAGQYGKAALESLGLWPAVRDRVAQADNVRAVLALVASGEAPLGIVYASDVAAEPAVRAIATFPEGSHPPILYPVALTAGAPDAARRLLDHLGEEAARTVFIRNGFLIPQ